ncbi:ABC transporter substrate-binding protein [Paenarthrobacter sp. NPDC018779]|uniref:ABC transporter substrate-binding protein n=1 Tax=Paenarthrobacter sp. NPDC018779 TaxID=3364375 RepID=UPI0037C94FB7
MKAHRAVAAVIAATALMASLSACGSSAGSNGDKTTISYFSWQNQASIQPLVDKFEEENPDINVDVSAASGGPTEYAQTLMTRIAGNQAPDVFHMSIETRNEVMGAGYARDLTHESFMEGLDPTAASLYTRDGKVYGMAPTAWAGVIVYNKDLLKKAGYDSVPTTLTEFIKLGKALKEHDVIPYMEDTSGVSGSFSPMLGGLYAAQGQNGKDPVLSGEKTFAQEWTPVIEQWQQLVTQGVLPATAVGVSGAQIKEQFMTGQVAMFRSGPWDFKDLNASGIDFAAAPFPGVDGGEPFVGGGPDSPYVISSKIDGAKLAAGQKFLSFINSAEGLQLAQDNMNQVSTSSKYDSKVAPQLQEVYRDYIKNGKYYWVNWPKAGTVMGQEVTSQWQLLIQGKATPKSVAEALDAKWNAQK